MASVVMVGTASAGEVRVGIAKHDLTDTEQGADLLAQYIFGRSALNSDRTFGLRPYLVVGANTAGNITYGGGGAQAEWAFTENWFTEFQLGLITHDGRTDLPPPDMPEERLRVLETERTYGCEVLFHLSPAIGRRVSERANVAFYWEHLSHGQMICDDEKNEGLDNFGIRVGFEF